jgi:hypothetical protein
MIWGETWLFDLIWLNDYYHCFNFLIMICLEEDSRLQEITLLIQQYSYMNSLIMSEFVSYTRQSGGLVWFMVLNTTFNNISVAGIHIIFFGISLRSVLLVDETGVPWENHQTVPSHWQTLSHNVVSSIPRHECGSNSQL